MLADAGVDVLVMDVTNAALYWEEWDAVFSEMQKMKAEGNRVPQFCFWAFNGPVISVVQDLYEKIYAVDKYKDLWFYWDGKPLLLYNGTPTVDSTGVTPRHTNPHFDPAAKTDPKHPHFGDREYTEESYTDYTKAVKEFFTLRTMWWGYHTWEGKRFVGTEDNWSFGYDLGDERVRAMKPEELLSRHGGIKEEFAVTPAQHPSSLIGKSICRFPRACHGSTRSWNARRAMASISSSGGTRQSPPIRSFSTSTTGTNGRPASISRRMARPRRSCDATVRTSSSISTTPSSTARSSR
jgi:hypothetical protein